MKQEKSYKNKDMNKKIIAIVGNSGVGKDTFARELAKVLNCEIICSYTTRPMRDNEKYGREHLFVDRFDAMDGEVLAYTKYGGYEYWILEEQVKDINIYVIDEKGLEEMMDSFPSFSYYVIYIKRPFRDRLFNSHISVARLLRDVNRKNIKDDYVDVYVDNKYGLRHFINMAHIIGNSLLLEDLDLLDE